MSEDPSSLVAFLGGARAEVGTIPGRLMTFDGLRPFSNAFGGVTVWALLVWIAADAVSEPVFLR